MNDASKGRQGGKLETFSVLVRDHEVAEMGEVVISVVRGERDQEQQGASWRPGTSPGDPGAWVSGTGAGRREG